jgi:hypothetical protein
MDEVEGVDASALARREYKGWVVVLKGRMEMGEGTGKGCCIVKNEERWKGSLVDL